MRDPPGMPHWYKTLRHLTRRPRDVFEEEDLVLDHGEGLLDAVQYQPQPAPREEALRDGTPFVRRILQRPIPKGAIELITIPVFGKQGFGKSKLVNYLVDLIIQQHGAGKVHCVVGSDFRALQASIDPTKPIQVLFLDDALDSAFSRGGTPASLRDAIKDYMKTRHKLEKAMRILHGEQVDPTAETMDNMHHSGLIYFFIGSQSFKALEKQFRPGLCIFKSPLEEDMQEINQYWEGSTKDQDNRVRQRNAAWALLFEVQQAKMEDYDLSALSRCIVVVPSRGPMRLESQLIQREYFEPPYGRRVHHEEKKPETQLEARLGLMNHLAALFNEQHDPTRAGAQGLLRDWVRNRLLQIHQGLVQDELLKVRDAPELLRAETIRDVLDRAKALRLENSRNALELPPDLADEDAIIERVATDWLESGADPLQRQNGIASARLYAFIRDTYRPHRDFRRRAEQLEGKILRLATAKHLDAAPHPVARSPPPPAEATPAAAEPSPEFTFDLHAWLDQLPTRMAHLAQRRGRVPEDETAKWTQRVRAYRLRRLENVPREDLALSSERLFGQPMTGRNLDHWVKEVESCLGMWMGREYEAWWKRMLDEGWRHNGLRDAPIREILLGGGSGQQPDITIHYQDNHVDYWSLKCYGAREHVTLTLHHPGAKKESDVAPELRAFLAAWEARDQTQRTGGDEAAWAPVPRLCVAYRESLVPGAEFYRVYERPEQIVPTATFNRNEKGLPTSIRWRR